MSAKKDKSNAFKPVVVQARQTILSLSPEQVRIRKNGIEFYSASPIAEWTEMTVNIECPREGKKVKCTGVVVDCKGNKHSGYFVSMLFTGLSHNAESKLKAISVATRAH